ncbi:MAG: radical SAM/SPASM domain-containing protein [Ignavibacteriae bacterium]|nr:radical SAM/SPASM domain-containing protein [Ignavibacteriota bacterium]
MKIIREQMKRHMANSLLYNLSSRTKALKNISKKFIVTTTIGRSICQYYEKSRTHLFKSVEIETTSICNRKCSYCPNYYIKRPVGYMEEGLFYKVIDELSEINYSGRLSPHFYGEPLLDKRIPNLISYARKKLPNAFIKLFTNGDLLTYDIFMELLDAGVDIFRIAQHDEETSAAIRETLGKIGNKLNVERIEYEKFYNNDNYLMNRGGLIEVKHDVEMKFCDYVAGVTIDYKGNVLLCCQDYKAEYSFGNIKDENILEIWNKKNYKSLRDKIKCGIWTLPICRVCNGIDK